MTDRLDNWQEQLQSEVISYNLSKPMTMIGFLSLPEHARKEYLVNLKKNGGSTAQIAEMFGCSAETVLELMKRAGVRAGGRRVDEADYLWSEFIKGYELPPMEPPAVKAASTDASVHPEAQQKLAETPKPEAAPLPPPTPKRQEEPEPEPRPAAPKRPEVTTVLRAFRVDLTGPIDAVLRRLQIFSAMVGDRTVCVTVSVEDET